MRKLLLFHLLILFCINNYACVSEGCNFDVFFEEISPSASVKRFYNKKINNKSNLFNGYSEYTYFNKSYSLLSTNYLFFGDGDILNEDFENATGWIFSNGDTGNKWVIGSAVNNGGSKSLYISNDDGVTNQYNNTLTTVVHASKDFTIPATAEEISISFDWKCFGEGTNPKLDYFNVWLVPDIFVPMMGRKITEYKDQRVLLGSFNNNLAFKSEFFVLDPKLVKGNKIVFEWINNDKSGWPSPAAIDNLKISTVDCTAPSNVIFEDFKEDSVFMKWEAPKSNPKSYDVYCSKDSIPPTKTTIPTKQDIKTTSFLLDELQSNTIYYVWIKSVCDTEIGFWSKAYKFKTACGVFNIPFTEGFNKDSNTVDCWTIIDGNEDKAIWGTYKSSSEVFEGDQSMRFYKYDYSDTIVNDDWLISPTLKMKGTYRLKYHYKTYTSGTNDFEVLLSKDGKETKDFKQTLVSKKRYNNDKYTEEIVILDNVSGDINIAWHTIGKGSSTLYIDSIIIEEVENCPEPMELDVEEIKIDKATIFWQDNFGGKKWEYFVQEENEGAPTGKGELANNKKVAITKDNKGNNLKPNTDYEYYVRVVCENGKYSIWSGPKAFRTACDAFDIPFSEGFNNDSNTIDCWSIIDGNKDKEVWKTISYDFFEGNRAMYFYNYDSSNTVENDEWLISPTLKMKGTYRLKYHYKTSRYTGDNEFELLYSKDGKEIKDFKHPLVATKSHKIGDYIEKTVILYNVTGNINIAWHINGKGTSTLYLDNVIIEEIKGCVEPMELDVKDVLSDKATIQWIDNSGEKSWEYFVQAVGKGEPTKEGTITSKKENIITTENETNSVLLPNAYYEFYVRTKCNDGKSSLWSGPFVFKTSCGIYNLPFWEGFNKDSKDINCWTVVDENKDKSSWKITTSGYFEGNRAIRFEKYDPSKIIENDDWLISPIIKMNGTYRLKYHYKVSGSGINEFEVLLSKDGKEIKDFKQTLVAKKANENKDYLEKKVILNKVSGDINIAWHASGKGTSNIFIDNVIIEEVEGCVEPLELDVKDILPNKATILWVDESDNKSWEYFVQIKGEGEPTKKGTITSKKVNDINIDNVTGKTLLPNIEYEFYVRSVCGDDENSMWSGPFEFRTACGIYDVPFFEGFNKDSESLNCWTVIDENNDGKTWKTSPLWNSYKGNGSMFFNIYSQDKTFENNEWLISPTIKTDGGVYRIKYHYKTSLNKNNEFEIRMSQKGTDIKNFTEPILPKQVYNNKNFEEKVIFVKDLKGDVNFAWHITSKGSSDVYIDNLFIEKIKGCPEPYYVKITEQTDNSVSIEWEQYESGDKWEVIAVPYGEEIPDDKDLKLIKVTKDPKATITGLDSGKAYTFYVRVICEDGSPSDWSTGKVGATKVKANDNCSGAYNIPVNNFGDGCISFTSGTLLGSTLSEMSKERCNDSYGPLRTDIWFEFVPVSTQQIINISDLISPSGRDISFTVALYADDCNVADKPIGCFGVEKTSLTSQKFSQLKIGKKYYLRLYSRNSQADVLFKICISSPTLYVSPSEEGDYSVGDLVKKVLVDSNCDLVSNIKYQAGDNSNINTFGYFNRQKTDFPYEKGIVLSTHAVYESAGPYDGKINGKLPEWLGDPDLNEVIDNIGGSGFGSKKYVSVLEFDFIPIKDSIKFEYIFASESYLSFCKVVCEPGGALFAAWLTKKSTGEGRNLALVPGTTEPIAISTIRDSKKTGAKCESINPKFFGQYYRNNFKLASESPVNYAGITVPMTSEKVDVEVGETYHIKIAIADFCDTDGHTSAVFFNGGSFDLGHLDLGTDMLVSTNTALCVGGEKTIYSGLDKDKGAISWYKDGVLIPGENDSNLTVSELGDYKVVGEYKFLNCEVEGSIRIEIFPKLEDLIGAPQDINYCVNSLTDKKVVDITTNEKIILKNVKDEDFEIAYYLTKEDSENNENAIEKPTEVEIPTDNSVKEIYVRVFYKVTGCTGYLKFSLVPQRAVMPVSPGDQQVCASYTFKELPEGQFYYTESKAEGDKYKAGDVFTAQGVHTIYICSIDGDCYEEVSFNLEVTAPVEAKEFKPKSKTLKCENYILPDLPANNRYFTEADGQGDELLAGNVIRFDKTIYVFAKSEQGPDYCIDQSSFTLIFEDCDIPKGISPNGDGINDVLDLEVHGVTSIIIYNRYGGEVYSHGVGYTNQWHGQDNSGNQLPDGTYYYAIESRGKIKTGWIQINR